MKGSICLMAGALLAIASPWGARAQDLTTPPTTIEQRLAALESAVAKLDTQLALEITRPSAAGGGSSIALESRVMSLERSVERLAMDIQRAERLAESASRAASDAQRDAMRAEQAARDAAMRSR